MVKKNVVLYYRKNRLEKNRLGITVSSKIGCAVQRNRVRRLLKENYRILQGLSEGYDIVLVARTRITNAGFEEIGKELRSALYESGILGVKNSD